MTNDNSLIEGVMAAMAEAGLDPSQPHDMRLFTIELSEPGTTIAEAAARAGARKARVVAGSGFDLLIFYLNALREDDGGTHAPAALPADHSALDGLRTLGLAIAKLREKGKK